MKSRQRLQRLPRNTRRLPTDLKSFRLSPLLCWTLLGSFLAVSLLLWVSHWGIQVSQDWAILQQDSTSDPKRKFDASLDIIKAIVSGIGSIATVGGGFFILWNIRLTQTRLITERFSKAIEQLGSDKIEVRLGGIYALDRIAQDSSRDHWAIMEVLTSFIQVKSPIKIIPEEQIRVKAFEIWKERDGNGTNQEIWDLAITELESTPVAKDIQAAVIVIGQRQKKDPPDKHLNLSYANLGGIHFAGPRYVGIQAQPHMKIDDRLICTEFSRPHFIGADLSGVNLSGAKLNGAKLMRANLCSSKLRRTEFTGADLSHAALSCADLSGAVLLGVDLVGGSLSQSNLSGAGLRHSNLSGTALSWSNLSGANFDGTILSGANFLGAINLTEEQLNDAKLCHTTLPDGTISNRDCQELQSKEWKDLKGKDWKSFAA